MKTRSGPQTAGRRVVIVGLGVNGSHVVPHVVRDPSVTGIVLLDPGRYEPKNVLCQNIGAADVGRLKVDVWRRWIARQRPSVSVEAMADRIENVPPGRLRGDAILSCVDSRRSRQYINQVAWRLGVPWIDSGVSVGVDGVLLARVNVYVPRPDQPCLECGWSDQDYATLEQAYPCQGEGPEPPPTGAPSSLGALAASIQAIELRKVLARQYDRAAVGRQILMDATWHKYYVTSFRRREKCRFDHETWRIERGRLGARQALRLALDLGRGSSGGRDPATLQVEGEVFITRLRCPACGHEKPQLCLSRRLTPSGRRCTRCGGEMVAGAMDLTAALRLSELAPAALRRSLRRIGLTDGDVITLVAGRRTRHLEIGGDRP